MVSNIVCYREYFFYLFHTVSLWLWGHILYNFRNLIGKQIIAVCNFAPKNIAGEVSDVLVLGAVDEKNRAILFHPTQKVTNGLKIY